MKKFPLISGIIAILVAVVIVIFASGARRIYSALLFIIVGIIQLYSARRNG